MKVFFKLFMLLIGFSLSSGSYAFPELPFCPAGGPPGWMNYFNNKRDQNTWRHYTQYPSPVFRQPAYYRSNDRYTLPPVYKQPNYYFTPPYNYNRNHYQSPSTPYRNY